MECKRVRSILLFFLLLFFPNFVWASDQVVFSCPKMVMVGNYVDCVGKLNSDTIIEGIQAKYQYDSAFTYVGSSSFSDWTSLTSNATGFALVNVNGTNTEQFLQTRFVVAPNATTGDSYKIGLTDILISDGVKDNSVLDQNFSIRILSVSDVIGNISVEDQNLELKDGVTDYTITVDYGVSSVSLAASLKDSSFSYVEGFGPRELNNLVVGENKFLLKIKNTDDENELVTYNLNIYRLDQKKDVVLDNPKTGSPVLVVGFILMVSLGFVVINYKKNIVRGHEK